MKYLLYCKDYQLFVHHFLLILHFYSTRWDFKNDDEFELIVRNIVSTVNSTMISVYGERKYQREI